MNLSGSLKDSKRDYDLRSSNKRYDRGDFVYKLDFMIKTEAKAFFQFGGSISGSTVQTSYLKDPRQKK